MPQAGFEPTIPASERPQTHVLDRAATEIGIYLFSRLFTDGTFNDTVNSRIYVSVGTLSSTSVIIVK